MVRKASDKSVPAASAVTNKRKADSADTKAKRQAFACALHQADGLPKVLRDMLDSCMPHCFPVEHRYQQEVINLVASALQKDLLHQVTAAEQAVEEVLQSLPRLDNSKKAASEDLADQSKSVTAAENCVKEAEAAVSKAQEVMTCAEEELRRCDARIGCAAMERHQLQADPASAAARALVDTPPFGSQPAIVGGQLTAAIESKDQIINNSIVQRLEIVGAIDSATSALDSAQKQLECQRAVMDRANVARRVSAEKMKLAWSAVRDVPAKKAEAMKAVAVTKRKLKKFRNGPLATLGVAVLENKSDMRRSVALRRMSFADVRKCQRRVSLLPRKKDVVLESLPAGKRDEKRRLSRSGGA